MGIIYATTMDPTKTELLTDWLPRQDFYVGAGEPLLETVGGFRLEDPAGQVGMEFIVARDATDAVVYHLPLSYRGQPLEGGGRHLLGTSRHGVLGLRYIYDGPGDPVWNQCVRGLLAGHQVPQHQDVSDTEEPRVTVSEPGGEGGIQVIRRLTALDAGPGDDRGAGGVSGDGAGSAVIGIWRDIDGRLARGTVLRLA